MNYETFKHINGKDIDITSEDYDIRDIVYLLLDEIQDGSIEKEVYKCTYLDGFEVEHNPHQEGFELSMNIHFENKYNRDYFEYLLSKRLDKITQLELCLANSIKEV